MQLRQRGFIMILSVSVGLLMLVMGAGMAEMCATHLGLDRYAEDVAASQHAAEAALQEAVYQVSDNYNWASNVTWAMTRSAANGSVSFAGGDSVNNYSSSTPAVAADGRQVPPYSVYLTARGKRDAATSVLHSLVFPPRVLMQSDFTLNALGWSHVKGLLPQVLLGNYVVGVNLPLTPQEQWEFAGDPTWDNYRADVEVVITTSTGFGVFVMADSTVNTNAYLFEYDLLTDALNGGSFMFRKVQNGVIGPPLVQVPRSSTAYAGLLTWLLGLKRVFTVKAQDGKFECLIDGVNVLTYDDPTKWRTSGMIGLRGTLGTVALVDQVKVTSNFEVKARW